MKQNGLEAAERQQRIDIVVGQCGGIAPTFEAFYIQSILYAATAAGEAFERFSRAVVRDRDAAVIVSAVQEALTHAASLSRFFWPARSKGVAAARAEKLRVAFKMEGSPLHDRGLRNALEHFDERLDEFLLTDPVGMCFPGPLVQPHSLADDTSGQIFRLVDPFEFVFVILGEKYDFLLIQEETQRLLELAHTFDQNGGRLRGSASRPMP